jgi:redox-sensing transcriptional repressor
LNKTELNVPVPTLKRLPLYHQYFVQLSTENIQTISCTQVADALKLTAIQIRKDLAYTGIIGKPKIGYQVHEILEKINKFLGWDNSTEAFLVGVGNLGTAILGYSGFTKYGLNIIAGFDLDTQKIGTKIHCKEILPLIKLTSLVQRMNVHIGIITVPNQYAQEVADLMIKGGIKAIWNFSAANIQVPDQIILQNENLATSLTILSKKLESKLRREI